VEPARNTRLAYSTGGERPEPETTPPARAVGAGKGGIRLMLERRASSRLVTVVTGLPGSPADVAALCRELKASCGAGGAAKGDSLELQGDQRERIEAVLSARGLRFKRAGG
jgi:translation initiation factor 1